MKIKETFFYFGSFVHHFQNNLSTHGSNPTIWFVSMSELEFFLLIKVLTQKSNTVEHTKLLERIKDFKFKLEWSHWRLHHVEPWAKTKMEKKVKIQDSMDKTNFFFSTMYSALVQF
jgi:hypothetical protein